MYSVNLPIDYYVIPVLLSTGAEYFNFYGYDKKNCFATYDDDNLKEFVYDWCTRTIRYIEIRIDSRGVRYANMW